MDDLIAFLNARLDQDEAAANAWLPFGNPDAAQREHIARHDPARVLADVAAKRPILERAAHTYGAFNDPANAMQGIVSRREKSHAVETIYDLASVYADHPDYPEEWKP